MIWWILCSRFWQCASHRKSSCISNNLDLHKDAHYPSHLLSLETKHETEQPNDTQRIMRNVLWHPVDDEGKITDTSTSKPITKMVPCDIPEITKRQNVVVKP